MRRDAKGNSPECVDESITATSSPFSVICVLAPSVSVCLSAEKEFYFYDSFFSSLYLVVAVSLRLIITVSFQSRSLMKPTSHAETEYEFALSRTLTHETELKQSY